MVKLKSITFKITQEAHDGLNRLAKAWKINQYQTLCVLLEASDPDDPAYTEVLNRVRNEWQTEFQRKAKARESLSEKIKDLTPEELEALVARLP